MIDGLGAIDNWGMKDVPKLWSDSKKTVEMERKRKENKGRLIMMNWKKNEIIRIKKICLEKRKVSDYRGAIQPFT